MKRNMREIVEQIRGTIPAQYDMTGEELIQLCLYARSEDTAGAIYDAFTYGYALALQMEKDKKSLNRKKILSRERKKQKKKDDGQCVYFN